ncbi:MAG TPA: exodeoxyribonuclease VII large subunit [Bacteroidales bacterium]|nr:exodeoxyribonuclease VII large subunit [Bacteroidales bacterium]
MGTQSSITLLELAQAIELGIQTALPNSYWVVAEISELTVNSKGHCFLELIEKPEHNETIIAKLRATIWSYKFQLLQSYFYASTGIHLQTGLKVLICVKVEFHAVYGLSVSIHDIDPVYTIGEEEKQRNEIIARLHDEGIFTMNKDLKLPVFPQRLAVISSAQAAGYQDFVKQIASNKNSLRVSITLFTAAMQGIETEQSIIKALNSIYEREHEFDAVIIIRGGGAKTDLRWFDNYTIASHIAQFPLPVITGIGHDKDISITDMVAHTSVKTPTAAAEFIISMGNALVSTIDNLHARLSDACNERIAEQKFTLQHILQELFHSNTLRTTIANNKLNNCIQKIKSASLFTIQKQKHFIEHISSNISPAIHALTHKHQQNLIHSAYKLQIHSHNCILHNKQSLELLQTKIELHNPQRILSKGYSITTNAHGTIINSIDSVQPNDKLYTYIKDGIITSTINKKDATN